MTVFIHVLSPAPEGYYWWVGDGDFGTGGGAVFADVPIQTDLQTGRYCLDYMLGIEDPLYGTSETDRSDNHIIDVVNEFTPRELNAVVQGNAVALAWLPPQRSEGLAGYRVYRDGQLIYAGPPQTTEILDGDLAGGVFCYAASAVYGTADEQLIPYEVKALIFSGGTGEPNDPYQLGMGDQLVCLADSPDLLNKAFLLVNDIDLDPNQWGKTAFRRAVIPVFSGSFDGGGHVISHLVIQGGQNLGLFGSLTGGAEVRDVGVVDANITGSAGYVGGLVGYNSGTITNSYSTGSVRGTTSVGGLVGMNYEGSIVASYGSGSTSGIEGVGGLVGWNFGGSIVASYSSGSAQGDRAVGGLAGINYDSVVMSYSSGSVSSTDSVGGLVGRNSGRIVTSYSSGLVSRVGQLVGGLVGCNDKGSIDSSFWDVQSSGKKTNADGTGLTTAQMRNTETFLRAGWDFVDEVANGTCDYWQIAPGDYPRLRYQGDKRPLMPEGLGTAKQPYLIRDARDLGTVWFEPPAHYRLAQSVDLSGITWSTAVIPWFGGSFEGSGHVSSNLRIQRGSYVGLLGRLGSTASVSNLGIEAVWVNGTGDYVGGLAGQNEGRIAASYSSASVSGNKCVGGLVGGNWGSIATSYSSGSVSGKNSVGGLVGVAGPASVVDLSFWDVQSSGWTTSDGGTGKTTAEMQMAKTFLDAGWDFVDETANGKEDLWWIDEGKDYPRLWWELSQGNVVP